MNKLKNIFNALATADRVEVSFHPSKTDLTQSECFVASVKFFNNTADSDFYIHFRDSDEYFAPVRADKKKLENAIVEGNKIMFDNIVVELFKFTEHNI